MSIPVLTTSRLLIRELVPDDLKSVHRVLCEAFGQSSLEERRHWLEWTVMNYRALDGLHQPPYGERAIILRHSAELIGAVGLVPAFGPFGLLPSLQTGVLEVDRLNSPQFGLFWALGASGRGQGYATEAAGALIEWVFTNLQVHRLVATTEVDNLASINVMKRLGMRIERNPYAQPAWFQGVGLLDHPDLHSPS